MIPRTNSLVKFDYKQMPIEYHKAYPFAENDVFVFLGEIVNMPGHCIVINHRTGKIFSGYHSENFIELTEDEI